MPPADDFDDPLQQVSHRPWPLPAEPWVMGQRWEDLLFAHWRVPFDRLRSIVPEALPLDMYDDAAWVTVAPFFISRLHARGIPPIPGLSNFLELNVRTYVTVGGKPGVYFFSLDASNALAVMGARQLYHLPYFRAEMHLERGTGAMLRYTSRRMHGDTPAAEFEAEYAPAGGPSPAKPGGVAHWLSERYCLYAVGSSGDVHRAEIHHRPWPLQPAHATIKLNTMATGLGLDLSETPQLLSYSRALDVLVWSPQRVTTD